MSKTTAAKEALQDHQDLLDLLEILKNIASNRFYRKMAERDDKSEVAFIINDFFKTAFASDEAKEFLLRDEDEKAIIIAFTADGGFMGNMTSKIINTTLSAIGKNNVDHVVMIGKKGREKLKPLTDKKIISFDGITEERFYETSLNIKDHIMPLIEKREIGKVLAVWPLAKTVSLVSYMTKQIFPPEELILSVEEEGETKTKEKVIFESDTKDLLNLMSGMWILFQLYEMFIDCSVAGFAVQSQQLENSLDTMTKIGKKLLLSYRKAKRSDIDKSLREAFSNTLMKQQ